MKLYLNTFDKFKQVSTLAKTRVEQQAALYKPLISNEKEFANHLIS